MARYLVYIVRFKDPEKAFSSGNFRIVEAPSASEAKRKGVEDLVLSGKGIEGKTLEQNLTRAKVELYKN